MTKKQKKEFFKYLKKQFDEIYKNSDEAKKTYTVQEINGVDTNIEHFELLDWYTTEYVPVYTSPIDKTDSINFIYPNWAESAQVNIKEEEK